MYKIYFKWICEYLMFCVWMCLYVWILSLCLPGTVLLIFTCLLIIYHKITYNMCKAFFVLYVKSLYQNTFSYKKNWMSSYSFFSTSCLIPISNPHINFPSVLILILRTVNSPGTWIPIHVHMHVHFVRHHILKLYSIKPLIALRHFEN